MEIFNECRGNTRLSSNTITTSYVYCFMSIFTLQDKNVKTYRLGDDSKG